MEVIRRSVEARRSRRRYRSLALPYLLLIVYVSVMLNPLGFHVTPLAFDKAWAIFLRMPYIGLPPELRADLVANVLMFVPVGFLLLGSVSPVPGRSLLPGAIKVLLAATVFVLAVKFAQLFVPPRTVIIDYVAAQLIGTVVGMFAFAASRPWHAAIADAFGDDERLVRVVLRFYAVAMLPLMLFPLDFVVDAGELAERIQALPQLLWALPGGGRSAIVQIAMVLGLIAIMMPLGAWLAVERRHWTIGRIAFAGTALVLAVTIMKVFVHSANLSLFGVGCRVLGVVLGAWLLGHARGLSVTRVKRFATGLAPILLLLHLAAVAVLRVFSDRGWRSIEAAMADLDTRTLIPFWNYYIVSKMQGLGSLAIHLAFFLPVGMLLAIRWGEGRGIRWAAAVVAAILGAALEVGRWLTPGLRPDVTTVFVAAVAGAVGAALMPYVWRVLAGLRIAATRRRRGAGPVARHV